MAKKDILYILNGESVESKLINHILSQNLGSKKKFRVELLDSDSLSSLDKKKLDRGSRIVVLGLKRNALELESEYELEFYHTHDIKITTEEVKHDDRCFLERICHDLAVDIESLDSDLKEIVKSIRRFSNGDFVPKNSLEKLMEKIGINTNVESDIADKDWIPVPAWNTQRIRYYKTSLTNELEILYKYIKDKKIQYLIETDSKLYFYGANFRDIARAFRKTTKGRVIEKGIGINDYNYGHVIVNLDDLPIDESSEKTILNWLKTDLSHHISNSKMMLQRELNRSDIYSYHIFTFPFKISGLSPGNMRDKFKEKKSHFDKMFFANQKENGKKVKRWLRLNQSNSNHLLHYNEEEYFYDFVIPSLYETTENTESVYFRSYNLLKEDRAKREYIIHCSLPNGSRKYELDIDSITIQLYNSGVGVLKFHLINNKKNQSLPNDILAINQYGRRIYPPFFSIPKSKDFIFGNNLENWSFESGLEGGEEAKGTKGLELANKISVLGVEEDFTGFYKASRRKTKLPRFIQYVIYGDADKEESDSLTVTPVLDDRMFVLCWYGNNHLSELVKGIYKNDELDECEKSLRYWHSYLYVDNPDSSTVHNRSVFKQDIERATYLRWQGSGSLIGATNYSFVALTNEFNDFGYKVLSDMATMYHKMIELCLVQKASIQVFTKLLYDASVSNGGMQTNEIVDIYRDFAHFENAYFHHEVTYQTQGIELYNLMQKTFQIDRDVKELDKEIRAYHDYLILHESEENNKSNELLNWVVTLVTSFIIVPSFVVGYFGMNLFDDSLSPYNSTALIKIISMIAGSAILTLLLILCVRFKSMICKNWWYPLVAFLGFALVSLMCLILKYPIHNVRENTQYNGQVTNSTLDIEKFRNSVVVIDGDTLTPTQKDSLIQSTNTNFIIHENGDTSLNKNN